MRYYIVCTYYNSETHTEISVFDKLWPIALGIQDIIVNIITLGLYVHKLLVLTQKATQIDAELYIQSITRFIICASCAITTTFIMYTMAILFFSNLTVKLKLYVFQFGTY